MLQSSLRSGHKVILLLGFLGSGIGGEPLSAAEAASFTLPQAKERIRHLLRDPDYPLQWTGEETGDGGRVWQFTGLKIGVFVDQFAVDPRSGLVTQALIYSRRDAEHDSLAALKHPGEIQIPRDYAARKAQRIARENFPHFEELSLPLVVEGEVKGSLIIFKWRSSDTLANGSLRHAVSLGLDSFNGRLTAWWARSTSPVWPFAPESIGSLPQAGEPADNAEVDSPNQPPRPRFVYPHDEWPTWSPDGHRLAFASDRLYWPADLDPEVGAIDAGRNNSIVFATDGGLRVLAYFCEARPPLFPAWSPAGDRIAFGAGDMVYDVHLETGELRKHTQPEREGKIPSWNGAGTLLAMYGERSHGDTDIFVADVARSLRDSRGQWRVAQQEGFDFLPTFHPREPWLVYVHESVTEDEESRCDLYRVEAGKPYWENEPPRKIVEDLPEPGRLSWFPDGQRLLVWHEKGLEIVDVAAPKRTPLALPPLHDPDFPEGPSLELHDVVIDPTGTKLTFSGLRWSGRSPDDAGWYLYVCALDGSGLQRITPVEDEVVPLYQFPQTGKTAADLAVEILQTLE